jgi:hypothetical protein
MFRLAMVVVCFVVAAWVLAASECAVTSELVSWDSCDCNVRPMGPDVCDQKEVRMWFVFCRNLTCAPPKACSATMWGPQVYKEERACAQPGDCDGQSSLCAGSGNWTSYYTTLPTDCGCQ